LSYRLVAIDLDGTLLNAERCIPGDLIGMIQEHARRGVQFTIATGRHYPSALPFALQLGLDIPIITYNGAMTRCCRSGEILRHLRVQRSVVPRIWSRIAEYGPRSCYLYLDDTIFADCRNPHAVNYARALGVTINDVPSLADLISDADPTLVAFVLAADTLPAVREILKQEFDGEIHVTNSLDNFLEVLHPEASKGKSLADLAVRLGIGRDEILAIGDNWNDLEMIEYAGTGALVGNSPPEIREQADFVATKARSEGVAEILRLFL
jgi:Cof subfamily protein (haloacid dehalogenase superfamily)